MTVCSMVSGAALTTASGASVSPGGGFSMAAFGTTNGPWYDVSDLTSLWQDTGKTVPATAVDDPVRVIEDQSGRGLDLVAPSDAARGLLKQDGRGKHYIDIAVNKGYHSTATFTATVPCWIVWAGSVVTAAGTSHMVFGARNATNKSLEINQLTTFSATGGSLDPTYGTSRRGTHLGSVSIGVPGIVEELVSSGAVCAAINGGTYADGTNTLPSDYSSAAIRVGVNVSGTGTTASNASAQHYYGSGFFNKSPSPSERAGCIEFWKEKMGLDVLEGQAYDVFAIGGQSNASGQGTNTTATAVPWGEAVEYQDGFLKPLAEPTRHYATTPAGNVSDTGSAWSAFAEEYFDLTGRRVCIVGGAASGIGIATWNSNALYRDALAAKVAAAQAFIASKGGTATFRGVIFQGGEADAVAGTAEATVESDLTSLIAAMRTAFGLPAMPVFLMQIDQSTDAGQDAAFAAVRQAITDVATALSGVDVVMPYQGFETAGALEDTIHWNQASLNTAGNVAATSIAALLA